MWTEQELKDYTGELYITRDFEDAGYAFVDILRIYKEDFDEPVYEETFMFHGECEKFLISIGFEECDLESGFYKSATN